MIGTMKSIMKKTEAAGGRVILIKYSINFIFVVAHN